MRSADTIEKQITNFTIDVNPDRDRQVLDEVLKNQATVGSSRNDVWRLLMNNKKFSFTTATTLIVAVLLAVTFLSSTPQAWAIEETIEAMKPYHGAYLSGVAVGQAGSLVGFNMWIRLNDAGTSSENVLVKLDDGLTLWTRDHATYIYLPGENTVLYEDALTSGLSHFLGPEFFELLTSLSKFQTTYCYDSATGRNRAMLSGSVTDVTGAKFLRVEFDVETKLVVSLTQWDGLHPEGDPGFSASTIRYFEQLPDDTFDVQIPEGVTYVEKPFTIPEINLEILSRPEYGMAAEGLTMQQAGRQILEQLYTAVIQGDLERFRNLAPVTADWTDDSLKHILRIGYENATVHIVHIGEISRQSDTPLGPAIVMPVTTKRKDGTVWQDKMIVQFRDIDGQASCVVHGPHGLPVQLQ